MNPSFTPALTGREHRVTVEYVPGKPVSYERSAKGTYFHQQTPKAVRRILETARETGIRLRLFLGDAITGRDWGEEHDTIGTVGRSTGPLRVPLLVADSFDAGGGAILDHCVVRVIDVQRGWDVYRHPAYAAPRLRKGKPWAVDLPVAFYRDGKPYAAFRTETEGHAWRQFIRGERVVLS
ncbi:MAG: hypothetical protein ACYC9L_06790 [Sulfuricaulis sp.]